ncbi:hypothetical protein DYB25_013221 [Aphanomyces astaci]|uniref:Uncharacterized protein n=1 Tax=Aphanomyces astaci TaxID=112090 RepID=A0A397AI61_APHAT|nr:hypothetical protein DYB25_013221 [Aphanomyces astaci]
MISTFRVRRFSTTDTLLDDAVDAPLSELSITNLFVWPLQRITYTRLLFCAGYVTVTLVALAAFVALVGLSAVLLPCVAMDAALRYRGQGWHHVRWPYAALTIAVLDPLVFCASWMHNLMCPKPLRISLKVHGGDDDDDDDGLFAYEQSPIVPNRRHVPPFSCTLKTQWNSTDDVRSATMYFLAVRPALCGFAMAWAAYIVANVSALAQAGGHWKDLGIFTLPQAFRAQDSLGTFALAMVLDFSVIVGLRMCVVRVMCWATRRFCCEHHVHPAWMLRTSMTEVSVTMEPFA